jgi:hypothetical protein
MTPGTGEVLGHSIVEGQTLRRAWKKDGCFIRGGKG